MTDAEFKATTAIPIDEHLPPDVADQRLINTKQLQELLPVSNMTIWRLEQKGKLPRHISIGGRNYWRLRPTLVAIDKMVKEGR